MEQTALNKLIEWVQGKIDMPCYHQEHLMEQEQWERVLDKCNELLPVEQEQMDKKCVDLLDYIINNCELDESGLFITINGALDNAELLQLFNQQNK